MSLHFHPPLPPSGAIGKLLAPCKGKKSYSLWDEAQGSGAIRLRPAAHPAVTSCVALESSLTSLSPRKMRMGLPTLQIA